MKPFGSTCRSAECYALDPSAADRPVRAWAGLGSPLGYGAVSRFAPPQVTPFSTDYLEFVINSPYPKGLIYAR